jgi:hypothetical protein
MRLSDILSNGGDNGDDFRNLWNNTEAADGFGPLPPGEYVAVIVAGELAASRTNSTPGYKLTFRVAEGQNAGRQFWHDCWLTPAALPQTKRDLALLGIASPDELEKPLPRFRCRCWLALRRDDDGNERNRLKRFEVIGTDKPDDDPFAPGTVAKPPSEPDPTLPPAAANLTTEGGDVVPF